MGISQESSERVSEYAKRHGLTLVDELGHGVHGSVFVAESQPQMGGAKVKSAVKTHHSEACYCRERDVYLRLKENGIDAICGCDVPQLLRFDDDLLILEMTVVSRPFVLDFGGAFLDKAPDFSEEVMADWRAEKIEQFGDRWPAVESILRELEGYGIHVIDVNPNNISPP
jgi:hypothetical protein